MRAILTAISLMMMLATQVGAEWIKWYEESDAEITVYIDDKINEADGYLYYWNLVDYSKLTNFGKLSTKTLVQLDCQIPVKIMPVSTIFYEGNMGEGDYNYPDVNKKWVYPSPNSHVGSMAGGLCEEYN